MSRQVEELIPKAIEAVQKHIADNDEIKKKYNGAVPSEYNGYISSFGASITRQFNFKATVANLCAVSSGSAKDKAPLMKAILELVAPKEFINNHKTLLDYILDNSNKESESEKQEKIINAVTALKLAVRTFQLKESKEEQGEIK